MTKRRSYSLLSLTSLLIPLLLLCIFTVSCKKAEPAVTSIAKTTASISSVISSEPKSTTSTPTTTALPEIKEYTVSFYTDGAGKLADVIIKEGEEFTFPSISLENADFDGWYFDRALTKKADLNSLEIKSDIKLYAKWIKNREIRLYTGETEYTSIYYKEGTTVDISKWLTPEPIIFKGVSCEFIHWVDEQLDDTVTESFTMPSKSLAFYAVYEDVPSKNSFYTLYDGDTLYYESIEANAMTAIDSLGGKYGRFEVTITETDRANSRLGIFINSTLEDNKKFGAEASGWGLYLHHNISANSRFAIVDYYNGYKTGISYEHSLGYASATAFTSSLKGGGLERYYNDNKAFLRGERESVTFTLGIETLPSGISVFVNGEYIGGVNDPEIVSLFTDGGKYGSNTMKSGVEVGFTTNSAGTKFSNFKYTPAAEVTYNFGSLKEETVGYLSAGLPIGNPSLSLNGIKVEGWYTDKELTKPLDPALVATDGLVLYAKATLVETVNNFYVYTDSEGNVTYEAIVANAMTSIDSMGSKYGRFEVTITETNPASTRVGLFFNANIPDSVKYGVAGSGYGFYFHHNISANSRFVLVDYYDKYRGLNDKDHLSISYNASSGAEGGGLRKYYEDNVAFRNGSASALVFTEAVEITPTAIKFYINGELIGSFTNAAVIKIFTEGGSFGGKSIKASIGVGFTTNVAGTRFSNIKFTPYEGE